jgi:transcriptional regulator with XRE-family HTH domain
MTLINIIQNYCDENKITMAHFSKMSGISRSYLFMLKNQSRTPGLSTYKKAAAAMGMELSDIQKQTSNFINTSDLDNISVPVYSKLPLDASNLIDSIPASNSYDSKNVFALRVDTGSGVLTVIAVKQTKYQTGDCVIATVKGEPFYGRYIKVANKYTITPFNPVLKALSFYDFKSSEVIIYGVAKEIRCYLF